MASSAAVRGGLHTTGGTASRSKLTARSARPVLEDVPPILLWAQGMLGPMASGLAAAPRGRGWRITLGASSIPLCTRPSSGGA